MDFSAQSLDIDAITISDKKHAGNEIIVIPDDSDESVSNQQEVCIINWIFHNLLLRVTGGVRNSSLKGIQQEKFIYFWCK